MDTVKAIAERTNYLNKDILYLKNTNITEYDIKSAGFTVIKYKKLLPEDEIAELEKCEKYERNVRIGKRILQYPKISEEIINTLTEVRKDFVVLNNIEADDILTIKKDAIFLIKKIPSVLIIKGVFEFRPKETYTSYVNLNSKEFYFSSLTNSMDVKGFPEETKETQKEFFFKEIKKLLAVSEKVSSDSLFTLLKSFRSKYLNRQLNKEIYRDLGTSMFHIGDFQFENIEDELLKNVDISQNYINYLLPFFKILL